MKGAGQNKRLDPAWGVLGAFIATVIVGIGLLVAFFSARGEQARIEENRAIAVTRSLSFVAARSSAVDVNRFIADLDEGLEGDLIEAYYLFRSEVDRYGLSTGSQYLANLDPALRGVDLVGQTDPRQKDIFDRVEAVVSGAMGFEPRLTSPPSEGLERTAPYIAIFDEITWDDRPAINVSVPVVSPTGELWGVAGVSVAELSTDKSIPVMWLLVLLVGGGSLLVVLGLYRRKHRLVPIAMLVGALVLMVAVTFVFTGWHAAAQHELLEQVVGDLAPITELLTEVESSESVAFVLRTYRDARARDFDEHLTPSVVSGGLPGLWFAFGLLGVLLIVSHRFLVRTFRRIRHDPWAYLYILPAMLAMTVLVFLPFLFGVVLSFHVRDADRFVPVGLSHFVDILGGEKSTEVTFYWTLFVTLFWTVVNVVIHLALGLSLAILLNERLLRFKRFYRVMLILPWAIPNYITALIWRGMFDTQEGVINRVLGEFGIEQINWIGGSFASAFTANLVTNVWLGFPFMMVVSLGALQSIPRELYEAAEVDGATRWQQFRQITLPLLKPALAPAVILGAIWTFNMFNVIYLVSGGGPNHSTEILITEAYRAFWNFGRWGYAAAYSVIIFVVLLCFSWMLSRITKAAEGAFE